MGASAQPKKGPHVAPLIAAVILISGIMTLLIFFSNEPSSPLNPSPLFADVASSSVRLFTTHFPASQRFTAELESLRAQGKLKTQNEILIQRTLSHTTERLHIPPAILWCLMFQESRFNHLLGAYEVRAAQGLGQFSYFSFYEINHHLDRYTDENVRTMIEILGKDFRPVEAKKSELHHPSSYYFIPTAVVTTATYLNNRYLQLTRALNNQRMAYNPELIWLYATMAYNKGGRTVFSLWNELRKRGGKERLGNLVQDSQAFFQSLDDPELLTLALRNIWSPQEAASYGRELTIHIQNIKNCAVNTSELPSIENGSKKDRTSIQ